MNEPMSPPGASLTLLEDLNRTCRVPLRRVQDQGETFTARDWVEVNKQLPLGTLLLRHTEPLRYIASARVI